LIRPAPCSYMFRWPSLSAPSISACNGMGHNNKAD
jgi:hypothetical protein